MRTFSYTVCILSLFLISSKCNDKPILSKETKILRGRLMYDCDTPAPNESVRFKAGISFIENIDGAIEVYTDENGYFEFIHNQGGSWFTLWAPYKVLEQIPSKPDLDLGEINLNGTVNFIIKLDIQNSYTQNDTLYYYNRNYPHLSDVTWLKVPGPFNSGILDTVFNAPFFGTFVFGKTPQLYVSYYINNHQENVLKYFDVYFCASSFQEVEIKIE